MLRGTALAALLWLTVEAFATRAAGGSVELTAPLGEAILARWTTTAATDTLGVRLGTPPAPLVRDWLVALRRAGTAVHWADGGIAPLAVEAERAPDPAGTVLLRVSGPAGASVRLADDLGTTDSLALGSLGASLRLAAVAGVVRVALGSNAAGTVATTRPAPIAPQRHLVVLGAAGWESKFVVAALEERGWQVDARLVVAPGLAVTQGTPFPLDTMRIAAVIALDSTASPFAPAIVRFVRSGGGLLLGPGAAESTALRRIAPGRGEVVLRPNFTSGGTVSRERLGMRDLAPLAPGALPLELRGSHVAVAVQREGAGRVGQVGYLESWRWRMEGGPAGLAGHRDWWAAVVASVAYGGEAAAGGADDPAPRAALFTALGAPSQPTSHTPFTIFPLVLGVLLLCLVGEWASRRLRGAR